MRVILFETTNATPHLETSLELAKIHLDRDDIVEYHFLGHSLDYCEFVNSGIGSWVSFCSPEVIGSKLIANQNYKFLAPRKSDVMHRVNLPDFSDMENLRLFRYKGYNAGLSALSSLISFTRNSKPDLDEHRVVLRRILESGISVYEYCLGILRHNAVHCVYLFNGRFANNRAILDAAIETKTPYLIHERGATKDLFTANPHMPHDFEKVKHRMAEAWVNRSVGSVDLAKTFFQKKRDGFADGRKSFTLNQRKGHLDFAKKEKKLIAYFSSSDDEYASVGDIVKWERWPDQLSAVRALIDIVRNSAEMELVIRIHPNMAQIHADELSQWINLDLPINANLLLPDDQTDSYELIDRADVVVTCGSTVGIEAVYWGTPSICLGPCLYSHLNAVYLPNDDGELESLLLATDLIALPEYSFPYGYFMSTFGEPFVYYQPETPFRGRFMSMDLQRSGLCGLVRRGFSFGKRLMLAGRKSIGRLMVP